MAQHPTQRHNHWGRGAQTRIVFLGLWGVYNAVISFGLILGLPLLLPLVATKAKRRHTYRQRLGLWTYLWEKERGSERKPTIWVHALSVGEVTAALPLVQKLQARNQDKRLVLTVSTKTGYQTACRLFAGQGLCLAFFPYDWLWAVRRVTAKINPAAVILVETDLWPNFLGFMKLRRVPVYLVNLRLSVRSWALYRRLPVLGRWIFDTLDGICVQDGRDVHRLQILGIPPHKLHVTGNIKFDSADPSPAQQDPERWRDALKIPSGRQVMVAGSTHAGEEAALFQAIQPLMQKDRAPVLIVAPRDPERASQILGLCRELGLTGTGLSTMTAGAGHTGLDVIVVDSLGVLKSLYGLADIVFVGGSLVNCGGHNPLEPAAWGKPLLYGPHMQDFAQIAAWLCKAQGARQVIDADQLAQAVDGLLTDPGRAEQMGRQARTVFQAHQGAVERTLECINLFGEASDFQA